MFLFLDFSPLEVVRIKQSTCIYNEVHNGKHLIVAINSVLSHKGPSALYILCLITQRTKCFVNLLTYSSVDTFITLSQKHLFLLRCIQIWSSFAFGTGQVSLISSVAHMAIGLVRTCDDSKHLNEYFRHVKVASLLRVLKIISNMDTHCRFPFTEQRWKYRGLNMKTK